MLKDLKLSHIAAGFIAVLVGYTSSVAIIFQAIGTAGATQAQAASWLLALGLGMGATCLILSLWSRMPVITAWSTPGAALLVTALAGVPLEQATGAFLFCGALLLITGLTGWFAALARLIPESLANAMLAGILFQFGLAAFRALESDTALAGAMALTFLAGRRLFPRYTIPAVLLAGILWAAGTGDYGSFDQLDLTLAAPVFVRPEFSLPVLISVGLPLFVVTMSSQNMPGVAALRGAGYEPPVSASLSVTGLATLLLAPFGGFTFNLAAITAAICAGPEAGENPATRYLAGREAALVTFMATVSGITFVGIGAPFWALLMGILVSRWLGWQRGGVAKPA